MKQVLLQILLVTPCSASASGSGCGLVGRYAMVSQDNAVADQKVRALLGSPLQKILDLSRVDENAARLNAELMVPKMASDLAYDTVRSALVQALGAEATYHGGDKSTGEKLQAALERIGQERTEYERGHEMSMNQLQYMYYLNAMIAKSNTTILPSAAAAR